jgi:hypothetical protein
MPLGTFGTLTFIETPKWTWLRQKLGGSLGSMKRDFFITKMSKRSSYSTIVSYFEGFNEHNPLSWYHEHNTQDIGLYTTATRPPKVSGKLTRDANAVPTVKKGSMQRTHAHKLDRLNCWETSAINQFSNLGQNKITC